MTERRGAPPQGFCLWLTGLSGAGKTTLAGGVSSRIASTGRLVEVLDGDSVRARLWPELGFSREYRDASVDRLAWLASRLVRAGAVVVVAATSPFVDARRRARDLISEEGPLVEVLVHAPVDVCARRDPKGFYQRARAGGIADMVGVDLPYERSTSDVLMVNTSTDDPGQCTDQVMLRLSVLGLLEQGGRPNPSAGIA